MDCTYPSILVIILAVAVVLLIELVSERRWRKKREIFFGSVNNDEKLDKRV